MAEDDPGAILNDSVMAYGVPGTGEIVMNPIIGSNSVTLEVAGTAAIATPEVPSHPYKVDNYDFRFDSTVPMAPYRMCLTCEKPSINCGCHTAPRIAYINWHRQLIGHEKRIRELEKELEAVKELRRTIENPKLMWVIDYLHAQMELEEEEEK